MGTHRRRQRPSGQTRLRYLKRKWEGLRHQSAGKGPSAGVPSSSHTTRAQSRSREWRNSAIAECAVRLPEASDAARCRSGKSMVPWAANGTRPRQIMVRDVLKSAKQHWPARWAPWAYLVPLRQSDAGLTARRQHRRGVWRRRSTRGTGAGRLQRSRTLGAAPFPLHHARMGYRCFTTILVRRACPLRHTTTETGQGRSSSGFVCRHTAHADASGLQPCMAGQVRARGGGSGTLAPGGILGSSGAVSLWADVQQVARADSHASQLERRPARRPGAPVQRH